MLNITAQVNAAGAKSYFSQPSEYYNEGKQEFIGDWHGKAAKLLGLAGQVDKPAFDRLVDNIHPQTGRQLTKIVRDGRRVGYDFTWSAPKSISVIHALTGDEAIVGAFRESINETMREMEADMQCRVRKGGQDFDRDSGNMVWAEFIHLTSRPVKGVVCPQLHAHCYAHNVTYDAVEGQWKAGQFRALKESGYYWQAVQQVRFAGKLQELGYTIRKTKDAFEIEGVPDSVLKKFSLRTSLIERVAEQLGITNPKSKAKLGATTREAKNNAIPYAELIQIWESQLTKDEVAAIGVAAQEKEPAIPVCHNAEHARFAIDHTFERASVADERRLLTVALRHGLGEVTPEGVRAEVDRHRLLKRVDHGKTWVTTDLFQGQRACIDVDDDEQVPAIPRHAARCGKHQGQQFQSRRAARRPDDGLSDTSVGACAGTIAARAPLDRWDIESGSGRWSPGAYKSSFRSGRGGHVGAAQPA